MTVEQLNQVMAGTTDRVGLQPARRGDAGTSVHERLIDGAEGLPKAVMPHASRATAGKLESRQTRKRQQLKLKTPTRPSRGMADWPS